MATAAGPPTSAPPSQLQAVHEPPPRVRPYTLPSEPSMNRWVPLAVVAVAGAVPAIGGGVASPPGTAVGVPVYSSRLGVLGPALVIRPALACASRVAATWSGRRVGFNASNSPAAPA